MEWATRSSSLTVILKKLFLGLAKSPESVLKRVFEPVVNPQKRAKFELLSEVNFLGSSMVLNSICFTGNACILAHEPKGFGCLSESGSMDYGEWI